MCRPRVARFLTEARPYAAPGSEIDPYAVRLALFDRLAAVRDWAARNVDFRQLLSQALALDPRGQALRGALTGKALQALITG